MLNVSKYNVHYFIEKKVNELYRLFGKGILFSNLSSFYNNFNFEKLELYITILSRNFF